MLTQLNRSTIAVLSGVAASLLAATAAPAAQSGRPVVVYAEPQENIRTERISYADLDLVSATGERTLFRRVGGAVRRVCLFENGRPGLQNGGYYSCADGAWDGARPQIAQAVARAKEIAMTGKSSFAATAITIKVAAN